MLTLALTTDTRENGGPVIASLLFSTGLASDGITTNQLVECAANMIKPARKLGPVGFLLWINCHEADKFVSRKEKAGARKDALTPRAEALSIEQFRKSTKYKIDVWEDCSATRVCATVTKNKDNTTERCVLTRDMETGVINSRWVDCFQFCLF